MTNPLLDMLHSRELPPFSQIRPEHAEPAVDALIAEGRATIDAITSRDQHDWQSVAAALEHVDDRLERAFAPVSHLHAVMNSDAWRAAYQACLPKLSDYGSDVGQNTELFNAWQALRDSAEYDALSQPQKQVINHALRDFRLAGVALNEQDKARYKTIQSQLSELSNRFENQLMDATQAWEKHIEDASLLAGLPDSALDQAAAKAQGKNKDGWLIGLDFPSYYAVITYADDRSLREEIYTAYCTRASDQGPQAGQFDNGAVMQEILALRHEAAQLLGFDNYADKSLAPKMAESPQQVIDFLQQLADKSRNPAERELAELKAFAKNHDAVDLQAWDLSYYAEKLKQHKHQLSDEDLRPYFPAPRVIAGMFGVVERIYGITINELDGVDTWHEDVTVYAINDAQGERIGLFYLDPYAREHKRGGAWMADCSRRRETESGVQIPVAFLTCNFTPPVAGKPALLTHNEVITLFHEFGHGLQHMLTRIGVAAVAGINGVPWDAVELPSQFMENFCWEREALDLFAVHHETGEKIPEDLYQRMIAAKNFQSALAMLRQIEFALFDLRLHLQTPATDVLKTLREVHDEVAVTPMPDFNRFANGFAHIFAGGYAAGYFSYKWAEVLSADAWSAFEEAGVFDRATGERFKATILEQGGSRDAMELFVEFRGREPSIEPLLRHSGLSDAA